MTPEEIITDEEIDRAYANANFGEGYTKRQIVNLAVLKCASGYYQGHTSGAIAKELGLVCCVDYVLTPKGKEYLWSVYSTDRNF